MEKKMDIVQLFSKFAHEVERGRKLPEFSRESKIRDLGIDSVAMMEIIGCFEDQLNIRIPDEKLSTLQTIADLERVVLDYSSSSLGFQPAPAGQA
jgi:acyl carrier protein